MKYVLLVFCPDYGFSQEFDDYDSAHYARNEIERRVADSVVILRAKRGAFA
jgi:hypothetical protein